jgi:hypothetical protein
MKERLGLLGAVDPYTGRYYSQAWIQRNVLRMNDDEIQAMQAEIDEEKEMGLGLPVGVTNDVAQQMMMSNVPQQPMNPADKEDTNEEVVDPSKDLTISMTKFFDTLVEDANDQRSQ